MKRIRNNYAHSNHDKKQKGSAIVLVMILSLAVLVILASNLQRGNSTRKINLANSLHYEAKNAAESYAEYGCADLITRFESQTSFPANELIIHPIKPPTTSTTFYTHSNIDLANTSVTGGTISDPYWIFLNPNDPRWEFDPLKGKKVWVRDVPIFAKATSQSNLIASPSVAYVKQVLQVRDSPLFSNAIFYNLELEFHPGPKMEIGGPVHGNKDVWVASSDEIKFHDSVSAAGKFLHGNPRWSPTHDRQGNVIITDGEGNFPNVKVGSGGTSNSDWLDHNDPDWKEKATVKWKGMVKDSAHEVMPQNAAGIKEHIPDDPFTPENELENHAYAVIEPLLPYDHPNRKTDAVRNQKMMSKAGLVLRVLKDASTETGFIVKGYKWDRKNNSVPVGIQNPIDYLKLDGNDDPQLVEVTLPGTPFSSFATMSIVGAANANIDAIDNSIFIDEAAHPELYQFSGVDVTRGLYDHREDIEVSLVSIDVGALRLAVDNQANPTGTDLGETYWKNTDTNTITYNPKNDWNGVVYVEFPIESTARRAADNIVPADPYPEGTIEILGYNNVPKGHGDYWDDGGTYIKYNESPWKPRGERDDKWKYVKKTSPQNYHLALQVINGEYIPSPTIYANPTLSYPGLTIATNAPLYSVGNYNADGIVHTNDFAKYEETHYKTYDGTASYREPPASFMCDSYTLLSEDWRPTGGRQNNRAKSKEAGAWTRKVKIFTEVSAAILTGIKPTIPDNAPGNIPGTSLSGGAHNFPRFLEDWDTTLTLRTSLVALFESEVHEKFMPVSFSHYSPPTRDWGFNQNFLEGVYPPGTPNVRSFRRTEFKDLTEAEYNAGIPTP